MDIVTRCTSYHSSSTISAQTKSKSSRFVRHRSSTSYAQSKTIPSRCALMVHLQQVPSVKSSQRTMSQLIYVRCPDKNNTVTIPFTSHLRHNSPTSDDRASQLNRTDGSPRNPRLNERAGLASDSVDRHPRAQAAGPFVPREA
ncbi:hypothetical protein BaRGS_00029688 [Batillaria attramentaria]|uniref:Uncharacterized protein n=1 Tax=Batillaria attramentaria TaxID=370345 RepID=A0ABD0JWM6_9CAEN